MEKEDSNFYKLLKLVTTLYSLKIIFKRLDISKKPWLEQFSYVEFELVNHRWHWNMFV